MHTGASRRNAPGLRKEEALMTSRTASIPKPLVRANQTVIVVSVLISWVLSAWLEGFFWILLIGLMISQSEKTRGELEIILFVISKFLCLLLCNLSLEIFTKAGQDLTLQMPLVSGTLGVHIRL